MPQGVSRDEALKLIREIRAGSVAAWHRFVDGYAGILYTVLHRYLPFASTDDRRDVFVAVLHKLRAGTLDHYDGRSALSTWLFIYTRSRCLDYLRSKRGRRMLPAWLRRLPAVDQRVFRLYYLNGLGCHEVRAMLAQEGHALSVDQLAETLERFEEKLDPGMRQRMAYDLFAQSVGAASGRLLDFLHHLRVEYEAQAARSSAEEQRLQQDIARVAQQVAEYVDHLPDLERKVIHLRFYRGRTAREAALELGLDGQRQIYTIEDRALRRLRGLLEFHEGREREVDRPQ